MAGQGWIKLHRKLLDNPVVCKDADYLAVWVYLLLNATHSNYKDMFKGKPIVLKPGQLITGRKAIASFLNISESKVQRILNAFEQAQQIEQQASNKNRLITILNWHLYQDGEQQNEQQVNSTFGEKSALFNENKSKSEQQMNNYNADKSRHRGFSNKEHERQMNNKRTTSEQQVNTYKNDNNDKNDKEINNSICNASETANDIEAVINFYIEHFSDHNLTHLEVIESYMDEMQPALVKHAMELAIQRDKRFFRYVRGILESWLSKGIKTIEDYEREELGRNKPRAQPQKDREGGPYVPNVEETRKLMEKIWGRFKYEDAAT
ncbi:DnaD domain protein [Caldicoprobacter algeriensis]|uniref:DnaD domain-containing protein n=1 Tax=Caldicoprobacter algeriensis TaxID=699281 RepID=UPI00207AB2FC|nr:DnaD domain protein [Caldicoprobacter algeriensis]MCM8900573.1 DnaD domain protein [Caldicoprobacter algeriensis]